MTGPPLSRLRRLPPEGDDALGREGWAVTHSLLVQDARQPLRGQRFDALVQAAWRARPLAAPPLRRALRELAWRAAGLGVALRMPLD